MKVCDTSLGGNDTVVHQQAVQLANQLLVHFTHGYCSLWQAAGMTCTAFEWRVLTPLYRDIVALFACAASLLAMTYGTRRTLVAELPPPEPQRSPGPLACCRQE